MNNTKKKKENSSKTIKKNKKQDLNKLSRKKENKHKSKKNNVEVDNNLYQNDSDGESHKITYDEQDISDDENTIHNIQENENKRIQEKEGLEVSKEEDYDEEKEEKDDEEEEEEDDEEKEEEEYNEDNKEVSNKEKEEEEEEDYDEDNKEVSNKEKEEKDYEDYDEDKEEKDDEDDEEKEEEEYNEKVSNKDNNDEDDNEEVSKEEDDDEEVSDKDEKVSKDLFTKEDLVDSRDDEYDDWNYNVLDKKDNFCFSNSLDNNMDLDRDHFLMNMARDKYNSCLEDGRFTKENCNSNMEKEVQMYFKKPIFSKENAMEYPNIEKNDYFYSTLNNYFTGKTGDCDFTIPDSSNKKEHSCNEPTSFSFYRHQLLPSKYICPETNYRGLLLYHGLGSGKTLNSIAVISNFFKRDPNRVICVIATPGLVSNFMNDLYKVPTSILFSDDISIYLEDEKKKIEHIVNNNTSLNIQEKKDKIERQINSIKDKLIKKRLCIMSYEMWGNRLRGQTSWNELVNNPEIVSKRKKKESLGEKQGLGHIISSSNFKQKKKDSLDYPIFNNTLVIMDEAQELIQPKDPSTLKHMKWVQQAIRNASDVKVLFLSATPIKEHPYELGILFNLLKDKNSPSRFPEIYTFHPPYGCDIIDDKKTKEEFERMFFDKTEFITTLKNKNKFKSMVKGLVSYYSIERAFTQFPVKIEEDPINIMMSPEQLKEWKRVRKLELSKAGSCSNPSLKGCDSSRKISLNKLSKKSTIYKNITLGKLKDFSNKIYEIANNVERCIGKQFIYSYFNIHGLYTLKTELRKRGWKEYTFDKKDISPECIHIDTLFTSDSKKREALKDDDWVKKADMTDEYKEENNISGGAKWAKPMIKQKAFITMGDNTDTQTKERIVLGLFNLSKNINGEYIQCILVNKKYSEGISLKHVRNVHLMESPSSNSLRDQIIGRAVRTCSHKGLEFPNEWTVNIYSYYSVDDNLGLYNMNEILSENKNNNKEEKEKKTLLEELNDLDKYTIETKMKLENKDLGPMPETQSKFLKMLDNKKESISNTSYIKDVSSNTLELVDIEREKIKQLKTKKEKIIELSMEAFEKGDKELASHYKEEKEILQKQIEDNNKKMVDLILNNQDWKHNHQIDLHGLYVNEALEATKNFLHHYYKNKPNSIVELLIITGAGIHSENKEAKIKPAIMQLLDENYSNIIYELVNNEGALKIQYDTTQNNNEMKGGTLETCSSIVNSKMCDEKEFCSFNDGVCKELPTDYIISKMADNIDFLKVQFLHLLKEAAIDCNVFKQANETNIKCDGDINMKDENSDIYIEDSSSCSYKQNKDECDSNKWCVYKDDVCLPYLEDNEIHRYPAFIQLILKDNKKHTFPLIDISDELKRKDLNIIMSKLDSCYNPKDLLSYIEDIDYIFITHESIRKEYKISVINKLSHLRRHNIYVWNELSFKKYKSLIKNLEYLENPRLFEDKYLSLSEKIYIFGRLNTLKEKEFYRPIVFKISLSSVDEDILLDDIEYVIKLTLHNMDKKKLVDYLFSSEKIKTLKIKTSSMDKVNKIIKDYTYKKINLSIIFHLEEGILKDIIIIFKHLKDSADKNINEKIVYDK